MPDPFTTALAVFFCGLYTALLRACYGPTTQLLAAALLYFSGLPPLFAAGAGITGNLFLSSRNLCTKELLLFAHRRLGVALGLFGIIGVILGHLALAQISASRQQVYAATCLFLLAAAGIFVLVLSFRREKAPPLPKGIPLSVWPFPGWHSRGTPHFLEFLSLPAVFLTGLGMGFGAGFWGLGAGLPGVILLAGTMRAPARVALATDFLGSAVIGLAALVSFIFAGHLNIPAALLFLAGTIAGSWAGNLAPSQIKAAPFRPAFGGLLLLAAAAAGLMILGHPKAAALLLLGGMICLCAFIFAAHLLAVILDGAAQKKTGERPVNQTVLHPRESTRHI